MKKRLLSAMLAVAMLFGSAAALPKNCFSENTNISASAAKSGVYKYKILKDGTVEITDYSGAASSVTIPSQISGRTVTSIGEGAFSFQNIIIGYDPRKQPLSIRIPDTVKTIEKNAFESCEELKSMILGKNITSIGDDAFRDCSSLKSISLPSGVKSIGQEAFLGCESLSSISIPKTVKDIGKDAFEDTKWLNDHRKRDPIIVVNGLLIDGKKCSGNVNIPNGVTTIVDQAFYDNDKITSVTIPQGVKMIEECAFYECSNLKNVTIPDGVTSVGNVAFKECKKLKQVIIPESVKSIGYEAFGYWEDWKGDGGHIVIYHNRVSGFRIYCYKGSAAEKYAINESLSYFYLPPEVRFAGANRYETASFISRGMYKSADTVVLATGLSYQDAMVAVPLAKAYNAPLLLTTDKQVTKYTEERLKKLNAKKVIIVSTGDAVGQAVRTALAEYDPTVISGNTCFETAAKVAENSQEKLQKTPETIFFATDSAFADALSASPVAAIKGAPIMYLKNTGSIDKATADYLKSIKGKVKNAYIIGGDGVISDAMMKNVATALGLTVNKTVQRVAGKNRYETCIAVNKKFKSVLTGKGICVAKGLDFPDALAGGVYAASTKQALFLADGKKLQDCQNTYLKGKNASKITVFGGTGAVPDELVKTIAQASV